MLLVRAPGERQARSQDEEKKISGSSIHYNTKIMNHRRLSLVRPRLS